VHQTLCRDRADVHVLSTDPRFTGAWLRRAVRRCIHPQTRMPILLIVSPFYRAGFQGLCGLESWPRPHAIISVQVGNRWPCVDHAPVGYKGLGTFRSARECFVGVLAHELAHVWQFERETPMREYEADEHAERVLYKYRRGRR
jgi:hypothetical protein